MRRVAALAALLLLAVTAGSAQAAPEWRSQQPIIGEGRAPLGPVGDLECWSADRCLLITGGNGAMPAGLYAYDGAAWYLYSTVCGGAGGRIAWAGPSEFWTVSDKATGAEGEGKVLEHTSLCHFRDGAVVASYAQPLGAAAAYLQMNAAACNGPDECWFAGERLPGTVNSGAFHLYWNGLFLAPSPSLTTPEPVIDPGRAVTGLAFHAGGLYEGVRVQPGDEPVAAEATEPSLLHRVLPGAPAGFEPVVANAAIDYGGSDAAHLQGFELSDDGEGLWAVSGANPPSFGLPGTTTPVTVLRLGAAGLDQITLGATSPFGLGHGVKAIAAEPGQAAVWVSYNTGGESTDPQAPARLALVHADGSVGPPLTLPAEGEGIGRQGRAGPLDCAAAGQCWMATQNGWLFHLGSDPGSNGDPAMHRLITVRPRDASLPTVPPISLPEDNSGSNSNAGEAIKTEVQEEVLPKRKPPLLSKLKQRLIGNTLELSFVLRVRAHVQLLAERKGRVVAKTKRYTMAKGSRKLRLLLDPKRWPTKLDLQVDEVKRAGKR